MGPGSWEKEWDLSPGHQERSKCDFFLSNKTGTRGKRVGFGQVRAGLGWGCRDARERRLGQVELGKRCQVPNLEAEAKT